jgi:signal transduction histidine kinase
MSRTRVLAVVMLLAGVVFGVITIAIARREPAYAFAGGKIKLDTANEIGGGWLLSPHRVAAEIAAGWGLLGVGLAAWLRRPGAVFGPLLAAGAFGWFALEWNNPGIGSAAGFAVGLMLYAAAPPLIAHAALSYPNRRLPRLEQLVVAVAYVNALFILGIGSAVVFDPQTGGCTECPSNLLLVEGSSSIWDGVNRLGVYVGFGWSIAAGLIIALRLARSSPGGRSSLWPMLVPAAVYLGLVALAFADSFERGALGTSTRQRDLWLGQALALVAVAAGVAWTWILERYRRAEVARLVIDIAESPVPGELRARLGRMLGDPSLAIGYPLADGRLVDAAGQPIVLERDATPLIRGGETLALLSHRAGLLNDPRLAEEVARAAHLALEHERLQAEVRAELEELRWSRSRVVAAGDGERRRLERDLHDGAQQRLAALSLSLGLLRSTDDTHRAEIDEAQAELDAALASLREVGHGLFPALLADEGLAAALAALTEETPVEIELDGLPEARFDASVEAAAYFVVAETLRRARRTPPRVAVSRTDDVVVVEADADLPPAELVQLEDRVGAAGGTLETTQRADGTVRIRAELPCAS